MGTVNQIKSIFKEEERVQSTSHIAQYNAFNNYSIDYYTYREDVLRAVRRTKQVAINDCSCLLERTTKLLWINRQKQHSHNCCSLAVAPL